LRQSGAEPVLNASASQAHAEAVAA